ncbi:hypothetical protein [Demequina litorisediminis]|uniref:Glycosyl hydrolases family 43 n=1 Tax=Demequina litorisediminis TaxID=1849022 RepID=A0ABQ6IEW6_9MICO|nr:hypothetical protein [Demequina litorisediminis]GMA36429.1 hypothetical protein GCM10025876_26330 [Demequina litorisediminis]
MAGRSSASPQSRLGVDSEDVVAAEEGGESVYYWYGEDRSNGYWGSPGVAVYRSTDLMNWTNKGTAMRAVASDSELTEPYFDALYDTVGDDGSVDQARVDEVGYYLNTTQADDQTAIFERPKVLYNERDDTWVMWWHADGRMTPGGAPTPARLPRSRWPTAPPGRSA